MENANNTIMMRRAGNGPAVVAFLGAFLGTGAIVTLSLSFSAFILHKMSDKGGFKAYDISNPIFIAHVVPLLSISLMIAIIIVFGIKLQKAQSPKIRNMQYTSANEAPTNLAMSGAMQNLAEIRENFASLSNLMVSLKSGVNNTEQLNNINEQLNNINEQLNNINAQLNDGGKLLQADGEGLMYTADAQQEIKALKAQLQEREDAMVRLKSRLQTMTDEKKLSTLITPTTGAPAVAPAGGAPAVAPAVAPAGGAPAGGAPGGAPGGAALGGDPSPNADDETLEECTVAGCVNSAAKHAAHPS